MLAKTDGYPIACAKDVILVYKDKRFILVDRVFDSMGDAACSQGRTGVIVTLVSAFVLEGTDPAGPLVVYRRISEFTIAALCFRRLGTTRRTLKMCSSNWLCA